MGSDGDFERGKERLQGLRFPIKVAVMGCEVNGPGRHGKQMSG